MHKILFALVFLVALTSVAAECPSSEELSAQVTRCANGHTTYFDDNNCKQVECSQAYKLDPTCPTDAEIATARDRCVAAGKEASRYTEEGCTYVECSRENGCFIQDEQNLQVEARCEARGLEVIYTETDSACPVATGCRDYEVTRDDEVRHEVTDEDEITLEIACKKTATDNCILISCRDGYTYNSCDDACRTDDNPIEIDPLEICTTTYDEDGCEIKSCPGVETTRSCPSKPFEGTENNANERADEETQTEQAPVEKRGFFRRFFGFLS